MILTVLLAGNAVAQSSADCLAIICPRNIEVPVGRGSETVVVFNVRATNTCDGVDVPVSCLPPAGAAFPVGSTAVECVAISGASTNRCSFTVTVSDDVPPKLVTPGAMRVPCEGWFSVPGASGGLNEQPGALVAFSVAATDNLDSQPAVVCSPPSESFFPIGTNEVACVATDSSGNRTSARFNVIVEPGPACEVTSVPGGVAPEPDNWGFELGLKSWTGQGTAFATNQQPVIGDRIKTKRIASEKQHLETTVGGGYWQDIPYPIGHKGNRWIGTSELQIWGLATTNEGAVGTLRSKFFTIEKKNINFLIGGHVDLPQLRVELLIETNSPGPFAEPIGSSLFTVMERATGHGQEPMHRAGWDVSSYLGKRACLRIVDASATGHLNVDDFRFDDLPPEQQTVRVGGTNYPAVVSMDGYSYDWDSSVWGMTDLHTHPMSSLGFGGKLVHGEANAGLAGLGDCNCSHGGWGLDNGCGDYWREILQKAMDDKGNSPHREGWVGNGDDWQWKQFRNWPVFTSIAHQQMWHEWVKRAYDGGLRVMVALCVNNPLLAHAGQGDLPGDDKAVGDMQIAGLKSFVANNDYFMEIAYDPYQLRDIVRRNKLAVIIGSELDDIGNISTNAAVKTLRPDEASKKIVRDEIDRLYGLGLRYIFPVHLMDNKFGGTAIGNDMLNMATKHLMGRPFSVIHAAQEDGINYRLTDFNTIEIEGVSIDSGLFAATAAFAGSALFPLIAPALGSIADSLLPVPPGAGAGAGAALAPLAAVGMLGALPALVAAIADSPIPFDVAPLPGNYPSYPSEEEAPHGIRNSLGLSDLGLYALNEMMKRGMMIDVDHMSQRSIEEAFSMATNNPVGYPLNSGHNSFRELGLEVNENHRTPSHLAKIRELGGLMGVGWENGPARDFSQAVPDPAYSRSQIDNDCAGTSKSFGQLYLYALEHMQGSHVALGTDIDGLIPTPGPRFGPQGAFALPETVPPGNHNTLDRAYDIGAQRNGVLYEPKHGKPLTTAAFVGPAVDPDREFLGARWSEGYRYNKDQRDFYAAIKIFRWFHPVWPDEVGTTQEAVQLVLESIKNGLSDSYGDRVGSRITRPE